MSDKRPSRAPALFDDAAFAEDLRRAGTLGREVALAARREFEGEGVPVGNLLACDEEGPDETVLRHCVKVCLPPPDGKFGMVLRVELQYDRSVLVFAAFADEIEVDTGLVLSEGSAGSAHMWGGAAAHDLAADLAHQPLYPPGGHLLSFAL